MTELQNANVTDRFVAIPYAVVRYQKSDSKTIRNRVQS